MTDSDSSRGSDVQGSEASPEKWSDARVMDELRSQSTLNAARTIFSGWSAKIEQAGQQRKPLTPIEMRRMEFEAVHRIVNAYTPPSAPAKGREMASGAEREGPSTLKPERTP